MRPSQKVLSTIRFVPALSLGLGGETKQTDKKAANPLEPSALSETSSSCTLNHVDEDDVYVEDEVAKKKKESIYPSVKHHYRRR